MDKVNEIARLWKLYDICIDATNDIEFQVCEPLHSNEAEWIIGALNNSYIIPAEKIKSITFYLFGNALNREDDQHLDEILDVLFELKEITENIDSAKDFVKLGGLDIVESLMVDSDSRLRSNAIELLGIINQNNYFCQTQSVHKDLVEKLLQSISIETDTVLLHNEIYALSCTVRGHEEAFQRFIRFNGFELILDNFLSSSSSRIRCKITFFVYSLLTEMDIEQINIDIIRRYLNDFVDRLIVMSSFCESEVEYMLGSIHQIMTKYPHIVPSNSFIFTSTINYQRSVVLSGVDIVREVHYYMEEIAVLLESQRRLMLN